MVNRSGKMNNNIEQKQKLVTDWIERSIRRYEETGENREAETGRLVLKIVEEKINGMKSADSE